MARPVKRKNIRKNKTKKKISSPFHIYWEKKNYLLLALGVGVIIIGYIFMSMGKWNSFPSLFISPILLLIGYVIILPASILYMKKKEDVNKEDQEIDSGKS